MHQLDNAGAVLTYPARETSQEGIAAEWRGVAVLAVDGELISRSEIFDEADLDVAVARLQELH